MGITYMEKEAYQDAKEWLLEKKDDLEKDIFYNWQDKNLPSMAESRVRAAALDEAIDWIDHKLNLFNDLPDILDARFSGYQTNESDQAYFRVYVANTIREIRLPAPIVQKYVKIELADGEFADFAIKDSTTILCQVGIKKGQDITVTWR